MADIDDNVQIVMRQTDYTLEEATILLQLNNNDVIKVIRLYLNKGTPNKQIENKPLTINQQIYKEIRDLLVESEKKVNA